MSDLIFLLLLAAVFGGAGGLVRLCGHLIGDEQSGGAS